MIKIFYRVLNKIKKYSDKYFLVLTNYQESIIEIREDLLDDCFSKAKQHFLLIENYLLLKSSSYNSSLEIETHKNNFLKLFRNSFKVKGTQISGGQGIIGSLFISYICSLLKINHIYEFGSFNFYLTKTLDDVLNKSIKIDTYDLINRKDNYNLSKRVKVNVGDPILDFQPDFKAELGNALFILDDRVNHKERFYKLISLGAKKIIFIDDLLLFGKLNPLSSNPYPSISMILNDFNQEVLILPLPSFTFAGVLRETDSVYVELL